jgi:hypothetical protein
MNNSTQTITNQATQESIYNQIASNLFLNFLKKKPSKEEMRRYQLKGNVNET